MSFEEKEEKLRNHMKIFGADPEEYEKKGLLYVKRFNALDIARSVEALLSEAKKELLIDSILKDIDIPKIYLAHFPEENKYECIDGKQRIYYLNKNTIVPMLNLIDKHSGKYCEVNCAHCHKK